MSEPPTTLVVLSRDECLELLASHEVGRLGVVVDDGQPVIFPVNYRLDGDRIVIRTNPGTKLSASALARVAFEIDAVDVGMHAGWSVVVKGFGEDISTAIDPRSEELRALRLETWAPGDRMSWIRIVPTEITGRRLTR